MEHFHPWTKLGVGLLCEYMRCFGMFFVFLIAVHTQGHLGRGLLFFSSRGMNWTKILEVSG